MFIRLLAQACNMPCPSDYPCLDLCNYIWRRVKVITAFTCYNVRTISCSKNLVTVILFSTGSISQMPPLTYWLTYFFILVCEAIGTAATPGLLCQPRVIVKMQMECRLTGETEVLEENLPQRHFCPSKNPTWPDPGLNPGRRGGKPATNRLSYGAAYLLPYLWSWALFEKPRIVQPLKNFPALYGTRRFIAVFTRALY
jgi:hypothetical protein